MKRIFAAVAISALALSGAAFAADAPSAIQKAQAPATTSASPTKPLAEDSHAKKAVIKKTDKKATTGTELVTPSTTKPATR